MKIIESDKKVLSAYMFKCFSYIKLAQLAVRRYFLRCSMCKGKMKYNMKKDVWKCRKCNFYKVIGD